MLEILPQLLINALITGSIYALASSGISLTYAILRIINFAHGHLMMTGAYLFYLYWVDLHFSFPIALMLAFSSSFVLGLLTMKIFIEPFRMLSTILPFVTTLALATMLEALVSIFFGVNVKSLSAEGIGESFDFGSFLITRVQVLMILVALMIMVALAVILHATPLGRRLRALSQHPEAAQSIGINARAISYGVVAMSTVLAAISGIMVGFETNMQPTMGGAYSIKASASMILGGLGNIWGTIFGSYFLGLVENLAVGLDFGGLSIPAGYKDAFAFVIILGVLLVRPQGIFTKRIRDV